jgi:predicted CxxxxCH...CXXCH cytochrome family protein
MVADNLLRIINPTLHNNGVVDVDVDSLLCYGCHGNDTNLAPPRDTDGNTDTSILTVGAHQAHLESTSWHRQVLCEDCHLVPSNVADPGHLDVAPAELIWSALELSDGASPVFDRAAATCSNGYCHGSTLITGGSITAPVWTTVDGSQAACGTCHGLPPEAPHPPGANCGDCHGAVIDNNMNFVAPSRHIDGVVDVTDADCNSCHGGTNNSAPPFDTQGNSETIEVTVGAHQAHLGSSGWHRELLCQDCHVVPANVDDPGHLDPAPAELNWSALVLADGASPTFDRAAATCAGSYCHGSTLPAGGSNTTPVWTTVDGSQAACGTCHGVPPAAPHPASEECGTCHGAVIDNNLNFVNPSRHIDGIVDVTDASCNSCHGGTNNSAPPVDTQGNSDTIEVTVGAHQAHLGSSGWHHELLCQDCHRVPANVDDPGHLDPAPAELNWSALVLADGANPSFDRAAATCAGSYCHGSTLIPGGSNTVPVWTTVDGSQASCGTCHGLPPGAPHPPGTDCGACHDEVYDGSNFVDASLHIDGIVQVTNGCGGCHGNPPTPETESYPGSGGAHVAHVSALGHECSVCHGHNGTGPAHDEGNGIVLRSNVDIVLDLSVAFPSGTTMGNGETPVVNYNGGTPSCEVGCHNPVIGDNVDLNNVALWTDLTIGCQDCHERPGLQAPRNHSMGNDDTTVRNRCQSCHDFSEHLSGVLAFTDPDPTDVHSYASEGIDGLCKTCHDGGGGTFFGATPADQSGFWTLPSAHFLDGQDCQSCHGYHGSTASPDLVASREEDLCGSCHDEALEMSNAGTPTHHHVVNSEQTGGVSVECADCHDPHGVTDARPIVHPHTRGLLVESDVPVDYSTDPAGAARDNGIFCLACHDGSWPGGIDVAAELANETTINTGFYEGDKNMHRKHRNWPNDNSGEVACNYCHNTHGNTGTSGINRGALLYDYMDVREYPYRGKNSCGTGDALHKCH